MQLSAHLVVTAAILGGADLIGLDTNHKISLAVLTGGVLIDLDKGFEVVSNGLREGHIPDITARVRILHSFKEWQILSFAFTS